jgi:formylmethanofuran dehydrogenase subunit E
MQDRHWEQAQLLVACLTNRRFDNMNEGIAEIRRIWEKNKSWVFPYMDENGRRIENINPGDEKINVTDIKTVVHKLYETTGRAVSQDERLKKLFGYDNGKNAVEYLQRFIANRLLSQESLENKLTEERAINGKKMTVGTKVSKYLKAFISMDDYSWTNGILSRYPRAQEDAVIDFIILLYSQFISSFKDRETDKVAISVNPVDILTASMHTAGETGGWTSCHNLSDGGYRTGPISYLCDSCSLIAFAFEIYKDFNPDFVMIPDHPVKKWRQMVFFDPKNYAAFLSREYTERKPIFSRYSRRIAAAILAEISGLPYHWKFKSVDGQQRSVSKYEDEEDMIVTDREHPPAGFRFNNNWLYNDWVTARIKLTEKEPSVIIGYNDIPCFGCGNHRDRGHDSTGRIVCPHCKPTDTCTACGTVVPIDGERCLYDYEGNCFCLDCWTKAHSRCSECGEWLPLDTPNVNNGRVFCQRCYDKVFVPCKKCGNRSYYKDTVELYDGTQLCPECAKQVSYCPECDQYFQNEDMVDCNGQKVCKACYDYINDDYEELMEELGEEETVEVTN